MRLCTLHSRALQVLFVDMLHAHMQMAQVHTEHHFATRAALADAYASGTFSKLTELLAFLWRGQFSLAFMEAQREAVHRASVAALAAAATGERPPAAVAARARKGLAAELRQTRPAMELSLGCANDDLSQRPRWYPPQAGPWCAPCRCGCVCLLFRVGLSRAGCAPLIYK